MFPTELRIYITRNDDNLEDIFNTKYVVNIKKSNNYKEEMMMLEQEKAFKLEQLNSLKGEYVARLEEIQAQDVNAIVAGKVASLTETIAKEVNAEHGALISKTEFQIEAINEMIADVENEQVEDGEAVENPDNAVE